MYENLYTRARTTVDQRLANKGIETGSKFAPGSRPKIDKTDPRSFFNRPSEVYEREDTGDRDPIMGIFTSLRENTSEFSALAKDAYDGSSGDSDVDYVVNRLIMNESGGNAKARNPFKHQTAGGLGQFIDSTWLSMIDKYKPEYKELPRSEKLALKFNGPLNKEMTYRYMNQNVNALKRRGLPHGPAEIYLAHFLGAGGAAKFLTSPLDAPMTTILSKEAMDVNPQVQGKSVGQVYSMFRRKMGVNQ